MDLCGARDAVGREILRSRDSVVQEILWCKPFFGPRDLVGHGHGILWAMVPFMGIFLRLKLNSWSCNDTTPDETPPQLKLTGARGGQLKLNSMS